MKNHDSSNDYKKLKEHLDDGKTVIVFNKYGNIGIAYKNNYGEYVFGGDLRFKTWSDKFEEICKIDDLEFYEPIS